MEKPIVVYRNMIWEILDKGSQLYLLEIMMSHGFEGECKLTAKIEGEATVMEVRDNLGHYLVIPIDILNILNE